MGNEVLGVWCEKTPDVGSRTNDTHDTAREKIVLIAKQKSDDWCPLSLHILNIANDYSTSKVSTNGPNLLVI